MSGALLSLWLASATGTVTGTIHERGEPLDQPFVRTWCPTYKTTEVDPETGRFEVTVPAGECHLVAGTNTGFRDVTVEVVEGETVELELEMVPRDLAKPTRWSPLGLSLKPDLQWPAGADVGVAFLNLNLAASDRLRVYGFDLGIVNRVRDRGYGLQAGVVARTCGWTGLQTGVVTKALEPEEEDPNHPGCDFGLDGVQLALAHADADLVYGLQLAGLMAEDFNLVGLQLAGVVARSHGALVGLQAAGVVAWSEWPNGLQVGGLLSVASFQLYGVQLAGVANVALQHPANGLQISSAFNYARCVRGLQIGLINVAEKAAGVQLGLINIIGRRLTPVLNAGTDRCTWSRPS